MLEEIENVNEVLYNNIKHKHLCLKLSEKNLLISLKDALKPFFDLTKKVSGEKYPSCNIVFYSIFSLRKKYAPNNSDTSNITKFLKSTLLESIEFYVREYKLLENKTLILANFITPNRKKFAIIENPSERHNFIRIAKETICELVRSHDGFPIVSQTSSENLNDSFDDNNYLPNPLNQNQHSEILKKEIETYELDSNTEKNSLLYWNNHKNDLPNLSNLSSKILAIPASTTPSERLFSKCKFQIFDRRNRISPENVESLMFLCENKNHVIEEWDWEDIE